MKLGQDKLLEVVVGVLLFPTFRFRLCTTSSAEYSSCRYEYIYVYSSMAQVADCW